MKHVLAGLVALVFGVAPALAAPEEDYLTLRTVLLVDANCGALKYMEAESVRDMTRRVLEATTQYEWQQVGKATTLEYDAWLKEVDAKATAEAGRVACGPEAQQLINIGRSVAAEDIYVGLLLAFHFGSLPEADFGHRPIAPDLMEAAQRYDGLLAQLYGANYQEFVDRMKQVAAAQLPPAPSAESGGAGLFEDMGVSIPRSYIDAITNAQVKGSLALDRVHFEVVAETAGYRLRPADIGGSWIIPSLVRDAVVAHVVEGPLTLFLPGQPWIPFALTLSGDGTLRLVSWGNDASVVLAAPTVRLYVGRSPAPEGEAWSALEAPDWRVNAAAFDAAPSSEGCLGAPCFAFPPEATAALAALGEGQYIELFVDAASGVPLSVSHAVGNIQKIGTTRLARVLAAR